MRGLWVLALAGGCGHDEPTNVDSGTDPPGACGDVSSIPSLTITGRVRDDQQNWLEGVPIELQERNWRPATHGTATSGADGEFTMTATDLPVVEDCWGTAVQFWLTGTTTGYTGDKPMNPDIEDAWTHGRTTLDVSDIPLILFPE